MGDFNVTFFFQVINFLIAWWALDRFFFRSCVAHVQAEHAEKIDKHTAVAQESAALQAIEKKQQAVFKATRSHFLQLLPEATTSNAKTVSAHSFIHVQECDVSTRKVVAQELVNHLVKRMTHD